MNATYAEINFKNLIFNYHSIRSRTKGKVLAVVKADAYGHGMLDCVKVLSNLELKPEYYGVAILEEALELRNSNIVNDPILCFAPFNYKFVKEYLENDILPTISTPQHITQLSKLNMKRKLRVHINVNTGMNRLGISHKEAYSLIKKLSGNHRVIIDGIYTHFATSDERDKKFANLQLSRFKGVLDKLQMKGIDYGIAHAANSGAILDMDDSYFEMVRPGISLYGYYPSLETSESLHLKPVMSLYSKISTISKISKGESVGYGRLFTAGKMMKCGSVPIGYADGLSRGLSNKINVIIGNKMFEQIGRISMDRINVNLKNSNIKTGAKVTLLGKSGKYIIDAWNWSSLLNTIPYEITCNISKRVPRKFIGKT